jgi:hypothetical protein
MTIIENSIKKFYLEDFYYFCQVIRAWSPPLV